MEQFTELEMVMPVVNQLVFISKKVEFELLHDKNVVKLNSLFKLYNFWLKRIKAERDEVYAAAMKEYRKRIKELNISVVTTAFGLKQLGI